MSNNSLYLNILKWICALLILAGAYLMVRITWPYFSFETDIGFLLTKQSVLYLDIWMISFYTHISTSLVVLLIGCIQFSRFIRTHYVKYHRLFGKIYVLLVLFCAAPGGLVMALYANGGFWARLSFVLISTGWWLFTFMGYRTIKHGHTEAHREWMIRSYALTLSALTLRFYVYISPIFIHLPARDMYVLVAWLSWIPNLLIAEWIIRRKHTIKRGSVN
ncbi:MAG: DUF2306 domain-containing protein [Bacteroidota bacterium]